MRCRVVMCLIAVVMAGISVDAVEDDSKELGTRANMRAIAVAAEVYAMDYGAYPAGNNVEDLRDELEPNYIPELPATDGWGHRFGWVTDGSSMRIVSGGPDGTIDPANLELNAPRRGDDLVFQESEFLE